MEVSEEVEISEGFLHMPAYTSVWQEAAEPLQIPVIIFMTSSQMFHATPLALWRQSIWLLPFSLSKEYSCLLS